MAYYVYAVVYAENTRGQKYVLQFSKRNRGYFFQYKAIAQSGQPLRGGGLFAFPGGAREGRESNVSGGFREFLEETGVDLRSNANILSVVDYQGGGFSGILIAVSYQDLTALAHQINDYFATADQAANDVIQGRLRKGDDLRFAGYPTPIPEDNELESAVSVQVTQTLISNLAGNNSTSWFAAMLRNLP